MKVFAFVAPKIIGGKIAPTPVGELGMVEMSQALDLIDVSFEQVVLSDTVTHKLFEVDYIRILSPSFVMVFIMNRMFLSFNIKTPVRLCCIRGFQFFIKFLT